VSTHLRVDLDAIRGNIARIRATVAPAGLMLVVKDDAYGHGLGPIVRTAAAAGVEWFGAFDVRTGSAVRAELGSRARIFAWIAASREDLEVAIADELDLGIGDSALLEDLADAARSAGTPARVHLKIDTGLHRNGVRPENWPGFVTRAAELEADGTIDVVGVWSHIAEASDADDDDARTIFDWAIAHARRVGLRPSMRHLAASAAAFARPEFRYDMVRVGAFCYGIRSAGGPSATDLGLVLAASLNADVVSVEDDAVTIGIGALDGVPSSLAGLAEVGTPDGARRLMSVDTASRVETWPGAAVGDVVTVYGAGDRGESSATDLAEIIGTIGEEIAVRVSPLVPREYVGG
jgi:alanine racemase